MQTFMREFSIIKKRILQYLEFKGISKYKFYQGCVPIRTRRPSVWVVIDFVYSFS